MKINKFIKIIFSIIIGILMLSCSSQNIMKKLAKTPDINCYKILENRNYSKYAANKHKTAPAVRAV